MMNASNESEYNEDTMATTVPGARLDQTELVLEEGGKRNGKVLNGKGK